MNLENLSEKRLRELLEEKKQAKKKERDTYKHLVEETVMQAFTKLELASQNLSRVKQEIFANFQDLVRLKKELYEIEIKQQSHTFSCVDGKSITIGYNVLDDYDDTLNAGIQKINNYLSTLAKDDNSKKLIQVINRLLRKDPKGNLKAQRVIELRNLADDIKDEAFVEGVNIILDSYRPTSSSYYIKASWVSNEGKKQYIPLAISSVMLPENFDTSFLHE